MKRLLLIMITLRLIVPSMAKAHPRFAVQEGTGCQSCHVNPTGAGLRNDAGGSIFQRKLSMRWSRNRLPPDITSRVARYVVVGTDLRVQNVTTASKALKNTTTLPQGSVYLNVDAGKYVAGYLDQDFANGVNREAVLMVHDNSPATLYLKAGRMNLPYGLRIDDMDGTAFIRSPFNLTFANQDIGIELGYLPGPLEIIAALSNGVPGGTTDENAAKASTSTLQWIGTHGRFGGSFQWNRRSATELVQGGAHGGFRLERLTWLGEIDWQKSTPTSGAAATKGLAGYSELAWKTIDGVYALTTYDFYDPDLDAAGDRRHRIGLGCDIYPLPLSHLSLLYRINIGSGTSGDDQILARLHAYF